MYPTITTTITNVGFAELFEWRSRYVYWNGEGGERDRGMGRGVREKE